jgi:hypothetical protein
VGSADIAYRPASRGSTAVLEAPQRQHSGAPERQRKRYRLKLQPCAFQRHHIQTCILQLLLGGSSTACIVDGEMLICPLEGLSLCCMTLESY